MKKEEICDFVMEIASLHYGLERNMYYATV